MGLGRNRNIEIFCEYLGHEDDCPDSCCACSISIGKEGDQLLLNKITMQAIKSYKKAIFANPRNVDIWVKIGDAYFIQKEYFNASLAYSKALSIDPTYGLAMFGKAKALKNAQKFDDAMELLNDILNIYDDSQVAAIKNELIKLGIKDKSGIYSIDRAIDTMTNKAYDIIQEYSIVDTNGIKLEARINQKVDFAKCMYEYCTNRYCSLGDEKVWCESIISSFYGAICLTLLFYSNTNDIENYTSVFGYLSDHINLDETERNALKLLGIRKNKAKIDEVWAMIYSYVQFCSRIIRGIEPVSDNVLAVKDASESAFVMGMLFAMRFNEKEQRRKYRETIGYDESIFTDFEFEDSNIYSSDGLSIDFGGLLVENGVVQLCILSKNRIGESKNLWLSPVILDGEVIGPHEHIIDIPPDGKWYSNLWPMNKASFEDSYCIDFVIEIDDENDNCIDRTPNVTVYVDLLNEKIDVYVDEDQ